MSRNNAVRGAQAALERAEEKIREAERARDQASVQLDAALADAGWKRLVGAFHAGATPLYTSVLYPDATLRRDQVLDVLARQESAAA